MHLDLGGATTKVERFPLEVGRDSWPVVCLVLVPCCCPSLHHIVDEDRPRPRLFPPPLLLLLLVLDREVDGEGRGLVRRVLVEPRAQGVWAGCLVLSPLKLALHRLPFPSGPHDPGPRHESCLLFLVRVRRVQTLLPPAGVVETLPLVNLVKVPVPLLDREVVLPCHSVDRDAGGSFDVLQVRRSERGAFCAGTLLRVLLL
mmetsp:Transcript_37518/g.118325  ORF Transcript_37518/g.118325 Transcript_37518/m.118325 type:complete len:201 (+) Transcript_37518:2887-3489(+)